MRKRSTYMSTNMRTGRGQNLRIWIRWLHHVSLSCDGHSSRVPIQLSLLLITKILPRIAEAPRTTSFLPRTEVLYIEIQDNKCGAANIGCNIGPEH